VLVRLGEKVQEVPRRIGVLIAALLVLSGVAGSVRAATHATRLVDPIVGTWRVTHGGSGTVTIGERAGVLAITAKKEATLGCVDETDDLIGFMDLPSNTALPVGHYNATFGVPGQGCSYEVALTLSGGKLTGKVLISENDQAGGPFTFVKTGGQTYRWSAKTAAITGSGSIAVDAQGRITSATGTVTARGWRVALARPGKLTFPRRGAFALTLAARVTRGNCTDRAGAFVLTNGVAKLVSVCGKTTAGTGSVQIT
jgi:hypothetical protein